jgi:hypothetical protein
MSAEPRSVVLARIVWILAGLLVVIAVGLHIFQSIHSSQFRFTTPYQAVLLSNGISAVAVGIPTTRFQFLPDTIDGPAVVATRAQVRIAAEACTVLDRRGGVIKSTKAIHLGGSKDRPVSVRP